MEFSPLQFQEQLNNFYDDPKTFDVSDPGKSKEMKGFIISDLLLRGINTQLTEALDLCESYRDLPRVIGEMSRQHPDRAIYSHDGTRRDLVTSFLSTIVNQELLSIQRDNPDALNTIGRLINRVEIDREQQKGDKARILPHPRRKRRYLEYIHNHILEPASFASLMTSATINSAKYNQPDNYREVTFNSLNTIQSMASRNFHWGVQPLLKNGCHILHQDEDVSIRVLNPDFFYYDDETESYRFAKQGQIPLIYVESMDINEIQESTTRCPAVIFRTQDIHSKIREFLTIQFGGEPQQIDTATLITGLQLALTREPQS